MVDEDKTLRRLGHIITININQYGNIIAEVSIFNELKYTIFLGEATALAKLNIGFGHILAMDNILTNYSVETVKSFISSIFGEKGLV